MSKDQRGWVLWLVAALVAVVVLFAVGLAVNSALDPFDDKPFDQVAWAAVKIESERGPMARDAIRHIPRGTPKERVAELLGEPDEVQSGYPPDPWGRRVKEFGRWSYWVGPGRGLWPYSFDSAFLIIYFHRDGLVVATEITGG